MTEVNLEISGDPGQISAHALRIGIQQTVGLLDEYAYAMSERGSSRLRWNVNRLHSNGNLLIGFTSALVRKHRARIAEDASSIASTLVSGLEAIDRDAVIPPYISESGMKRVESFVTAIEHREARAFTIRSQGKSASVTEHTGHNLAKLIEVKRRAIGSVEGRLVGINVATGRPHLSIVHKLTKRAVSCAVDDRYMEMAKDALGKRVVVYGTLLKNMNGETIRIEMRDAEMHVFSDVALQRRLAEMSSLPIPDFANTTDTDEYLIRTRGDQ